MPHACNAGSGHPSPPPSKASASQAAPPSGGRRRRAGAARRGWLLPARPHLPAHQPAAAGSAALCGRTGAGRLALVRVRGAVHPGCAPAAGGAPAAVRTGCVRSQAAGGLVPREVARTSRQDAAALLPVQTEGGLRIVVRSVGVEACWRGCLCTPGFAWVRLVSRDPQISSGMASGQQHASPLSRAPARQQFASSRSLGRSLGHAPRQNTCRRAGAEEEATRALGEKGPGGAAGAAAASPAASRAAAGPGGSHNVRPGGPSPCPGSPRPGSPCPGSPCPGSPSPGSPCPGSPCPGSPCPGSPC